MAENINCPKCGEDSASCQAHDDTDSSDSYFQGFSVCCGKCGYEDEKRYLYSGDAQEGHVIGHDCPYCGVRWDKHGAATSCAIRIDDA